MSCITCGLSNKDCNEWGYPFLVKTETTYTYCDCDYCEGHGTTVDLPESEWYWKPRRIDMGGLLELEDQPSKFLAFVNQMPQDNPIHRPVDWSKVSYE